MADPSLVDGAQADALRKRFSSAISPDVQDLLHGGQAFGFECHGRSSTAFDTLCQRMSLIELIQLVLIQEFWLEAPQIARREHSSCHGYGFGTYGEN